MLILPRQHRDEKTIVRMHTAESVNRRHVSPPDPVAGIAKRRVHRPPYTNHHGEWQPMIAAGREYDVLDQLAARAVLGPLEIVGERHREIERIHTFDPLIEKSPRPAYRRLIDLSADGVSSNRERSPRVLP